MRWTLLAIAVALTGCPTRSPQGFITPDAATGGDGSVIHHDGGGAACSTLDERSCYARTDCIVDRCPTCTCETAFVGCRAPDEMAHVCPGLGCDPPGCCSASTGGCLNGEICLPPGAPLCGGPSICGGPPMCGSDSDCAAHDAIYVCDASGCCPDMKICVLGCTDDSQCDVGMVCTTDHHCIQRPCNGSDDCPHDFHCDGSNGSCWRNSCMSDSDCGDKSFCVGSSCYESQGTCIIPPP
jgi:hypothetical protein